MLYFIKTARSPDPPAKHAPIAQRYPPERTEYVRYGRGARSLNNIKNMSFIVYVLKDSNGHFYKGLTNNLKRRLTEHRSGHTKTTSKMRDLKVVYTEEYVTFEEARKRELYLKSAAGRKFLKKKLRQ